MGTVITNNTTELQRSIGLSIPEIVKKKLTQSEFQIVSASLPSEKNRRIQDMPEELRLRLASTIVLKAITRLVNREIDERQQEAMIDEIDSDLIRKFNLLTGLEILKALEMGLDGEFSKDKIVYFTPSNFVIWVRSYIEMFKNPTVAKFARLNSQVEDEDQIPTIEQALESKYRILKNALDQTMSGVAYQDYGGVVYSLLDELKLISLTPDQKWKYMDMAKLTMLSEAQSSRDRSKVKSVMKIIEEANSNPKHEAVSAVATRLIVIDKLKDLKPDEIDSFLETVKLKIEEHVSKLKYA